MPGGKKSRLRQQFVDAAEKSATAFAGFCDGVINIPNGDGKTYRQENQHLVQHVDPRFDELQASVAELKAAADGLRKYINKNQGNTLKKNAVADADRILQSAIALRGGLLEDYDKFMDGLTPHQRDALTSAPTRQRGLDDLRQLLGQV